MKDYNDDFLEIMNGYEMDSPVATKAEVLETQKRVQDHLEQRPKSKRHKLTWIYGLSAACAVLALLLLPQLADQNTVPGSDTPPAGNHVIVSQAPIATEPADEQQINYPDIENDSLSSAVIQMATDGTYLYYADEGQLRRLDLSTKKVVALLEGNCRVFQTSDCVFVSVDTDNAAAVYSIENAEPVLLHTFEYDAPALTLFVPVTPIGIMDGALIWYTMREVGEDAENAETHTQLYKTSLSSGETALLADMEGLYPNCSLYGTVAALAGDGLALYDISKVQTESLLVLPDSEMWQCLYADDTMLIALCRDMANAENAGIWSINMKSGEKRLLFGAESVVDTAAYYDGRIYYTTEGKGVYVYDVSTDSAELLFGCESNIATLLLPTTDGIICFMPGGDERGCYFYRFNDNSLNLLIKQKLSGD